MNQIIHLKEQQNEMNITNYRELNFDIFYEKFMNFIEQWAALEEIQALQQKLIVCSSALRDNNVDHVGFNILIPSTIFGEMSENHTWSFDIEGISDNKRLEDTIKSRLTEINAREEANKIELDNKSFSSEPKYRMNSLMQRKEDVKRCFDIIDSQLNHGNSEQAIILTSLAFYEIERLSKARKNDYMIYNKMFNTKNYLDIWTACMNVKSDYIDIKHPTISNMIH